MDTSPPHSIALRSVDDVLAAVPYLIGFHPSRSLAVVGLDRDAAVFAARVDLPPGDAADAVREMAGVMATIAARQRTTDVVIIGYGPSFHVDPAAAAAEIVLIERGFNVLESVRVEGGRYWSYLCEGPSCCPPEGWEYDPASTEVAAAATYAGRVALPDQEALWELVAPVTGAEGEAMRQALRLANDRLTATLGGGARFTRLLRRFDRDLDAALARVAVGERLGDYAVAWLATALTVEACCQRAWQRTSAGDHSPPRVDGGRYESLRSGTSSATCGPTGTGARPSEAGAGASGPPRRYRTRSGRSASGSAARRGDRGYLELWWELTRRAAPSPAAATLLAYAAWLAGEGALASAAVRRALDPPGYLPAHVMAEVLSSGVPPDEVADRLTALRHDPDSAP
ncbi:MAG: DUF4192 domain-containing protein [Micromonosporaceae bacterium]